MTKSTFGGKGSSGFHVHVAAQHGRKSGQKPEDWNSCGDHGGTLLVQLPFVYLPDHMLREGMTHSGGGALLHQ